MSWYGYDYNVLTIESVQIIDGGGGNIYGEIMVQYHLVDTLYRRRIGNAETKAAGDFLTLTADPCKAKSDRFTIYVSLYDGDDLHDIAVGHVHAEPHRDYSSDMPLRHTFRGRYGAVSMKYNIIDSAVIKVTLLGDDSMCFYGTVTARQCLGDKKGSTAMILFARSVGDQGVPGGGEVPLDRCVVAVSKGSHVVVQVDLRDGDKFITASGSVKIHDSQLSGDSIHKIIAPYVQVSITHFYF